MKWVWMLARWHVAAKSRMVLRRLRLGYLSLPLILVAIAAGGIIGHPALAAIDLPDPGFSIAMRDGLITATFSEQTDDAVLNTAVPELIAKRVQAVSLRGAPVRNLDLFARMKTLKGLDICGTQVRDLGVLAGLSGLR